MSRKHAELEREFIAELAARTGRTLETWMAAIDASGLTDRNAVIDWLRPQGLTFAHASWLERIHHNGGRPIYLGVSLPAVLPFPAPQPPAAAPFPEASPLPAPSSEPEPPAPPVSRPLPGPAPVPAAMPAPAPTSAPAPVAILHAVRTVAPAPPDEPVTITPPQPALADLLARGKGLRPLAEFLMSEIRATLPSATFEPAGDLVSVSTSREIAVLLVSPKELRLGLALPAGLRRDGLIPARLPGAAPHITQMLVINDARRIDGGLMSLLTLADGGPVPI